MNSRKQIGKRRQLIESILYKQASKNNTEYQIQTFGNAAYQSEYQKQFCDISFTPTLENDDLLHQKEFTHPLRSSFARTLYAQQVMEGILKVNSPLLNLKEPFKKQNIFTDDIRTTIKKMN